MEKITTEIFLTTLFKFGFDKVDPVLLTYMLSKTTIDNINKKEFDFQLDIQMSKAITKEEGPVYRLSDEINKEKWFKYHTSEKLLEYFKTLNIEEIVSMKLDVYGYKKDDYIFGRKKIVENKFSEKELDIATSIFERTNEAINKAIEEEKRISATREEMMTSNHYVEWLIAFAKVNNSSIYYSKKEEQENTPAREKINDLPIFYELISNYVMPTTNNNLCYCALKYNGEVFHIGKFSDPEETYYVSVPSSVDEKGIPKIGYGMGCTEYSTIIEKYKKQNHPEKTKGTIK